MYTFVHRPGAVSRPLFSHMLWDPPTRGLFEKYLKPFWVRILIADPKSPQASHAAPIHPNRPQPHQTPPKNPTCAPTPTHVIIAPKRILYATKFTC